MMGTTWLRLAESTRFLDHLLGITMKVGQFKGNWGHKTTLTSEEELKLVEYMHLMVKWGHSIIPIQVKVKVVEVT